jgi:transcriptional regulator with XRE-family HTH domain
MQDPEETIRQVGRRVGELRELAGYTQAEAAERLEMGLANYKRIEYGHQNLTLRLMVRIANAFGVRLERLLERPRRKARKRGRPARPPAPARRK